jgi:HK97 family phage major capsid protein
MKNRYGELQTELEELKARAEDSSQEWTQEDYELVRAKMEEQKQLKSNIETEEALNAQAASGTFSAPGTPHIEVRDNADLNTYTLGEYLRDIVASARSVNTGGNVLPRVAQYQKQVRAAATGASESVPSDGGFLVGEDFASEIIRRAYDNNQVLSRCRRATISTNANSMKMNGVDETDRANGSRHGGIRSYWMAEADSLTASKPKFRQMNFELNKHAILFYATDEVIQDAALLESLVQEAVSDELAFVTQDAIINGSGSGKPLGILESPALVTQAKESGQSANTILYENLLKMLTRKWGALSRYVWLVNQEIYPQLGTMSVPVGTGGAPAYLPAGGASEEPFTTLFRRPVIEIEQAAALGTAGDIILADLSQYQVIDKGGVQSAMSIHVEFTSDEIVYRWITRIDGQPLWNSALTPYKGSATRSPFVALATRS